MNNRFSRPSVPVKQLVPFLAVVAIALYRFQLVGSKYADCLEAFPAGKNVHVELKNISGTITVESLEQ